MELTEAARRAVADTVRRQMASYADAVRALDADRILGHYVQTSEFRLYSDGQPYSYADMQALAQRLTHALRASEIHWDTVEVTVLSPDAAIAAAPFRRADTDTAGLTTHVRGMATWVWVRRDGKWRMLYGHGEHHADSTTDP